MKLENILYLKMIIAKLIPLSINNIRGQEGFTGVFVIQMRNIPNSRPGERVKN